MVGALHAQDDPHLPRHLLDLDGREPSAQETQQGNVVVVGHALGVPGAQPAGGG
jgi:hypothetical protein